MPKSKKEKEDKEWAKRYLLDPLNAPEPSQLDGPGSSFFNPRRSLSLNCKPKEVPLHILQKRHSGYPTPPDSASPTRSTFQIHHPKPFSPGRRHSYLPPTDWAPADVVLKRSQSLNPHAQRPASLARSQSLNPSSQLPHFEITANQKQPIRRKPVRTNSQTTTAAAVVIQAPKPAPPAKSHNLLPSPPPKSGPLPRLQKATSSPRPNKLKVGRKPPQTHRTQGTADIISEVFADRTSNYVNRLLPSPAHTAPPPTPPKPTSPPPPLRRTGSFLRRLTGTMSYQSPEMSKPKPTEERERERRSSSNRKHRSRHSRPYTDTIDSLDRAGGVVYHHEGPYDATLAAVNSNKKKSPLEAVKHSNNEAIKATPREYIQDSLTKHVPLQGTSNIPSGMPDQNGNVLYYQEGADLMREPDAPGGAYRRYDFVKYHPDDLKGKGEPSYSIEKAMKENKNGKLRKHSASFSHGTAAPMGAYEMESRSGRNDGTQAPLLSPKCAGGSVRRKSFSHGSATGASAWGTGADLDQVDPNRLGVPSDGSGLGRSSSTSHRFADGIKRRFGSLRRK